MASENEAPATADAIAEGRRIYLGNLLYTVTRYEIQQSLREHGFTDFEAVHMAVDDATARNPGYCFVDFTTREGAERALESLRATIRGRILRVGPCKPRRGPSGYQQQQQQQHQQPPPQQQQQSRWGISDRPSAAASSSFDGGDEASSRRLYVGGLGEALDEAHNTEELTQLLTGFKITSIGKRIAPHDSKASLPGTHHYCFVELETPEEAHAAIQALDGKDSLRVSMARPPQNKTRSGYGSGSGSGGGSGRFGRRDFEGSPAEQSPRGARSMASDNWRRRHE
ncbi:Nucleotide-binding, alpha-beta plait [Moelleriella libera RCEF 2490]|uniref:Nucleotide-binding, alpha-beta plait n=1 Tax=Moelleriella libera RCEF 2490 TaxID=1081109 RepID=A0A167ZN51_9HYPO|nr:Nucleotide-binding, alpha-beta plait [Moelleriella libera RCEF 2490]